jgi:hypothetical protein
MQPVAYHNREIGRDALEKDRFAIDTVQEERAAADALMRIQCVNSVIVECIMVTMLYEWLAFIIETTPATKWLPIYSWLAGMWCKQSQCEAIDQ